MATLHNVVIRDDLGRGLDVNDAEQKINVKVDGTTVRFNSNDEIEATGGGSESLPTVVKSSTLSIGAGSSIFTHYMTDGTSQDFDLSALATDINVTGGTFDAATLTLTLTQDDGGDDVLINLAELSMIYANDTTTVYLTGDGSQNNPLEAEVRVDALVDNQTTTVHNGVIVVDKPNVFDVELQSTFGNPIGYCTSMNTL